MSPSQQGPSRGATCAPTAQPALGLTCAVEVILAVGEVFQERDALGLVVVASGCLQQHDLRGGERDGQGFEELCDPLATVLPLLA